MAVPPPSLPFPEFPAEAFPGLAFPYKWTSTFFNQTQKTLSGASIDIGLASTPLLTFELTYSLLRQDLLSVNTELQTILIFYAQMNGPTGRFLFSQDLILDRTATGAQIGVGNGTQTSFLMTSPITGACIVPESGITIKVNGTDVSATTTLIGSPGAYRYLLASAPTAGQIVTFDGNYGYYAKFVEDMVTMEKFSLNRFECTSIKIETCRAGA